MRFTRVQSILLALLAALFLQLSTTDASSTQSLVLNREKQALLIKAGISYDAVKTMLAFGFPRSTWTASRRAVERALSNQLNGHSLAFAASHGQERKVGARIAASVLCYNPRLGAGRTHRENLVNRDYCGMDHRRTTFATLLEPVQTRFNQACSAHNLCYNRCGSDYTTCNAKMGLAMIQACESLPVTATASRAAAVSAAGATTMCREILSGAKIDECLLIVRGMCYAETANFLQRVSSPNSMLAFQEAQKDMCVCEGMD